MMHVPTRLDTVEVVLEAQTDGFSILVNFQAFSVSQHEHGFAAQYAPGRTYKT